MQRSSTVLSLIAVVASLVAAGPASARQRTTRTHRSPTAFLAGAAELDTTPPLAGTAAGNQADAEFMPGAAGCSKTLYPTQGVFALQEPYDNADHTLQWDAGVSLTGGPQTPPDPYCDVNGNGNWDGIYADNGRGPMTSVHDPIDVRAFAIAYGTGEPLVYASVDQIGIFDYYTQQARQDLADTYHVTANLVVSADHNESSPDSLGLYGAEQTGLGAGIRSGIDEFYMAWLDDRIAHAAALAVHALQPADLYADQVEGKVPDGTSGNRYPLLVGMSQRISDQFPTSVALPNDDRVAAVDTKLGVLVARTPSHHTIFTVMNLAAHNQEMGNSGNAISADWPGAFEHAYDSTHQGIAIFLVGDNGSEEDPESYPPLIPNGSENHTNPATQFIQVQGTGAQFATIVAAAARAAVELTPGPVTFTRQQFCIPLENNAFIALAAAGEFGDRQGYICNGQGEPTATVPNSSLTTASTDFRTFVSTAEVGPDLQMIDIPGEAFPALMLGSPFSQDTESCNRPNPSVPIWHARALFRFMVGLADDEIGYLIPAWGFASGTPGLFNNDLCYQDMHGHGHKLESESAGPTSANDVANRLTTLLDQDPDPSAHLVVGRYVLPDGTFSSWPTHAIGILTTDSSHLDPDGGTFIGAPGIAGAGGRAVDATGMFMDYDGQPQSAPDVTTRGMIVLGPGGCVVARYYVNVFPDLSGSGMGDVSDEPPVIADHACRPQNRGQVAELQPIAADQAGLPIPRADVKLVDTLTLFHVRRAKTGCARGLALPAVTLHIGRTALTGTAVAHGCGRGTTGTVARVVLSIFARPSGPGTSVCRFLEPLGTLGPSAPCAAPLRLLVTGTNRWTFPVPTDLPAGRYDVAVRAFDTDGLGSRTNARSANGLPRLA
jgi:hypothetical protein